MLSFCLRYFSVAVFKQLNGEWVCLAHSSRVLFTMMDKLRLQELGETTVRKQNGGCTLLPDPLPFFYCSGSQSDNGATPGEQFFPPKLIQPRKYVVGYLYNI